MNAPERPSGAAEPPDFGPALDLARRVAATMSRTPRRSRGPGRTLSVVTKPPLSLARVFASWWPLAASWAFMGVEMPLVSAVMARLADPEIHLAAYGGVVFPVALIIEAPIIMLLAASTALGRDPQSYRLMHRFMMVAGGLLTIVHAIFAFTPAFDTVLVPLLGPPEAVIEPARIGLMIMLPWTWTIAYRRFHQGLLIRFGHPGAVGVGTAVRLATVTTVALTGLAIGSVPGVVVATLAIAAGVSAEALYTGLRTRPVVRGPLAVAVDSGSTLSWRGFVDFYVPLALTSLLLLLVQPIGAAAIGRMPAALASLAAWPVVNGLVFLFRSMGYAYNEVVVALMDEPGAEAALQRFTVLLAVGSLAATVAIATTPLATLWFGVVSGLPPALVDLARHAFWFGLAWAPLDVVRNYLQGRLVHARRTRGISESVAVFLVVSTALLTVGVALQQGEGLVLAMVAFVTGTIAQIGWLLWRLRGARRSLAAAAAT